MMFEEELKKEKNPAVIRIGNYLKKRADKDPSVKNNLQKENKSLKECWDYVLGEVAKTMFRSSNFGCAAGDDEEIDMHWQYITTMKMKSKLNHFLQI